MFVTVKPINDYIKSNLDILFVGYNPSIRSSETGHHFANPNNRFWTILYRAGLTPKKYEAVQDQTLLELGYGLTNIVPRPTKTAQEITKTEYQEGRKKLINKIKKYKPRFICFVGKGVYKQYSGNNKVDWGVQPVPVVKGTIEFVAPSSSGLVRMKLDEVVDIYKQLASLLLTKKA